MNMYRFTWMGHDQCVATTLREHNDLKDSAKAYTQQISADPLRETLHDHRWENCRSTSGKLCISPGKLCRSTQGNSADPLRSTLQIHSGKLCRPMGRWAQWAKGPHGLESTMSSAPGTRCRRPAANSTTGCARKDVSNGKHAT